MICLKFVSGDEPFCFVDVLWKEQGCWRVGSVSPGMLRAWINPEETYLYLWEDWNL